jgi:ribosome-binding factor A
MTRRAAKSPSPKSPSQRQLRVGEEVRHALAAILERGDLRDPDLRDAAVTVTEVQVSPDLRRATAFVTPLGGGGEDDLLAALERARPFLRRRIARAVTLKYVPDLAFRGDRSLDRAGRIQALLDEPMVARDLEAPPDARRDDDGS